MAKILLVEDDKSLREIYGVRLYAEGYDIVSAGDGEEALAMAIKERPDLIVSDVMMPKISGFDMLDILRSTTETKNIKVIMMTALSSEDQRQRGEQLGADRYLVKSQVGIEDVVRTVHDVLEDAPMSQQQAQPQPAVLPASSAERPSAPVVPPRQQPMATTPIPPQPVQSYVQPEPQQVPAQPATPQIPAQPVTTPASSLPQPTAPFSTPRPAGLADRIIQPLDRPEESGEPIASLMDKELGQSVSQPVAPTATPANPQPAPQTSSQSVQSVQVMPAVGPATQSSTLPTPTPPANPNIQQPASPVQTPAQPENHGIAFEETPRQQNNQ